MYSRLSSQSQQTGARWRPYSQFAGGELPASVRRWLLDQGSLTARLRRQSGGQFRVQVLHQGWGLPTLSERRLLGMGDRDWGVIREVLLLGREQPWVYARSIMPARSLTGHLRRLRRLDSRPLGHLLFTDPSMKRVPYEVCRFPGAALPVAGLAQARDRLWGRRSCFLLAERPIMVSEIFLPAFQPW